MDACRRMVVGITGATGIIYGVRLVDQTIGRVLDQFSLDSRTVPRWGETISLLTESRHETAWGLVNTASTK